MARNTIPSAWPHRSCGGFVKASARPLASKRRPLNDAEALSSLRSSTSTRAPRPGIVRATARRRARTRLWKRPAWLPQRRRPGPPWKEHWHMHDADRQPTDDNLIAARLRSTRISGWAVLAFAWSALGGLVACGGSGRGTAADGSPASGGSQPPGSGGGTSSTGGANGVSTGGVGVVSTGGAGVASTGGAAATATGGAAAAGGSPAAGGAGAGPSAGGASAGGGSPGGAVGQGNGGASGGGTGGQAVQMTLASLPVARQEHGVVALLGQVYVLGGYTPDVTSSVMASDPAKDSWRSGADFPSPFNHPAAGVIGDQIYVGGFYAGTSLTGPADGRTYVYDPKADAWSQRL